MAKTHSYWSTRSVYNFNLFNFSSPNPRIYYSNQSSSHPNLTPARKVFFFLIYDKLLADLELYCWIFKFNQTLQMKHSSPQQSSHIELILSVVYFLLNFKIRL